MPLVEHLTELRRRLIISVLALVGGAIVGFILYNQILSILLRQTVLVSETSCDPVDMTGDIRQRGVLALVECAEGFSERSRVVRRGIAHSAGISGQTRRRNARSD